MLRYIARIIQVKVISFLLSQMTQPTLSCAIFFPLPRSVDAFRRIINQAMPFRAINLGAGGGGYSPNGSKGVLFCYMLYKRFGSRGETSPYKTLLSTP